ncbi:hypothetical protein DL96DRAFT_1114110 [Flagelloscypha sp. PMI_526]|nr:hypothetical protein DL96DRAFT_1114110 [Flagelloscypha sp. PMI_526]
MTMDAVDSVFIFSTCTAFGLALTMVFFILTFRDLDGGILLPRDVCDLLYKLIFPENIAHAFLAVLLLVTRHFEAFFINAPLLLYNLHRMRAFSLTEQHNSKSPSHHHHSPLPRNPQYANDPRTWQLDPSTREIFEELVIRRTETPYKAAFYGITFIWYLHQVVSAFMDTV